MFSKRAPLLIVGLSFIAGCGPRLPARKGVVPVTGKMVRANGEPVKRVLIELVPEDPELGVGARGATDEEGVIHLSTYSNEEDDGAVPGEYTLKLEPIDKNSTQVSQPMNLVVDDDGLDGIKLKE